MEAKKVLSKSQKIILFTFAILYLFFAVIALKGTVIATLFVLTIFYTVNIFLTVYTLIKSIYNSSEIQVNDQDINEFDAYLNWPKYTILCPLYKEANVLENFVKNISKINYPKNKLECLLLLEEDDKETYDAAVSLNLPEYFTVIIIPHTLPKTKPKACNVGLEYATGDYLVIYDAEDCPDPSQLKESVVSFNALSNNVGCIQAKLNYYNQNHNFLTKMFTSEYTLWFVLILPGFQAINAPIPLGGTSNHFKISVLRELNGWDPYNVTEDCDLGIRLKANGYETAVLDSTTWEEANSKIGNWIRQRSRWIKGYFQTFLVHIRRPLYLLRNFGFINFMIFFINTGFLPFTTLINPFLWLITISYFIFRPYIGSTIEQFFPPYILYPGVFCLVIGNFIYVYNYLIGASKGGLDSVIKYGLLMPIYWILISVAGWYGLTQLLFKPHFWEKTKHGLSKGAVNV